MRNKLHTWQIEAVELGSMFFPVPPAETGWAPQLAPHLDPILRSTEKHVRVVIVWRAAAFLYLNTSHDWHMLNQWSSLFRTLSTLPTTGQRQTSLLNVIREISIKNNKTQKCNTTDTQYTTVYRAVKVTARCSTLRMITQEYSGITTTFSMLLSVKEDTPYRVVFITCIHTPTMQCRLCRIVCTDNTQYISNK